jgi:hypothetical protein
LQNQATFTENTLSLGLLQTQLKMPERRLISCCWRCYTLALFIPPLSQPYSASDFKTCCIEHDDIARLTPLKGLLPEFTTTSERIQVPLQI